MNYSYAITPYIQTTMAQAMQAVLSGAPLPANCFIVALPMQQAQQLFPQIMMTYAANTGGFMMFSQQSSFFNPPFPTPSTYPENVPNNAIMPYKNYYNQGYNTKTNYNYPVVPYTASDSRSKKKPRQSRKKSSDAHCNVYNSSSFDSYMHNLSWSRLFERPHIKNQPKDQAALSYDQKSTSSKKQRTHSDNSSTLSSLTSSTSSSTTSDETIRRVDVSSKQSTGASSTKQQQTKSSLPFKYSSEFVPGTGKEQSGKAKKESKVKIDDVFVIKKPPSISPAPPPSSTTASVVQQETGFGK